MKQFESINDGNRLIVYLPYLEEGLKYAKQNNIADICIQTQSLSCQINNPINLDLKLISNCDFIEFISFSDSKMIFKKGIDLNYLSALKNLKGLRLDDSNYIINFNLFPNLNYLEFYHSSRCKEMEISKLINLEYLHVYNFSSTMLQELSSMEKLKTLILWDAKKLISLDGLSDLNNLERIDLIRAVSLEDIGSLRKHSKLSRLTFLNCRKLSNISVISEIQKLKVVSFNNCKSIKDYFQITPNNSIVAILLKDVDSLQFIKKMNKLERIAFEKVLNNDLSPLFEVKSLKMAGFPSKRAYSYTEKEVNDYLNNQVD